jgi:hypothetical protein
MKRDDLAYGPHGYSSEPTSIYDLAGESQFREESARRAAVDADDDTREIRAAINQLAKRHRLGEGQVIAILSTLQARCSEASWAHHSYAVSADEALTDCIFRLETGANE